MCFVIGMEVLDNMPHDRFYTNKDGTKLTHQVVVNIDYDDKKKEILTENKVEISQVNDEISKLCVNLYETMPTRDHISATKILK